MFLVLLDSVNIEDDIMWNQAVQTIEKTVIIMQTVSDTLKKFSYSVSFVFILHLYILYFLMVLFYLRFSQNNCFYTNFLINQFIFYF